MKIGSLEGTPEEVKNFAEDFGLNISDYLEKPNNQLALKWIVLPSTLLVICFGILTLFKSLPNNFQQFIFLLGFASSVWIAISTQIRFKNMWAAGAIIIAGLLIMLVALGVLAPLEILEHYKNSPKKA